MCYIADQILSDQLEWVEVHLIQEMMTKKYGRTMCGYVESELDKLKKTWWPGKSLGTSVKTQLWNPTHERMADLEEM